MDDSIGCPQSLGTHTHTLIFPCRCVVFFKGTLPQCWVSSWFSICETQNHIVVFISTKETVCYPQRGGAWKRSTPVSSWGSRQFERGSCCMLLAQAGRDSDQSQRSILSQLPSRGKGPQRAFDLQGYLGQSASDFLYCYWVGSLDFTVTFWIPLICPFNRQKVKLFGGPNFIRVP